MLPEIVEFANGLQVTLFKNPKSKEKSKEKVLQIIIENPKELTHIITQGESDTVEFKQSFSKSVIETLVAFSNTRGGRVIIEAIENNKYITINEIADILNKGTTVTKEKLRKLKEKNIVQRIGPAKGGH